MTPLTYLTAIFTVMRTRFAEIRDDDRERGSFSLEQAVIAACLLALAVGLAAVLVTAVTSHESTIK